MKQEVVLRLLDAISKKVSNTKELRRLNSGGCGYFAGYVKFYLDALGVPCEVVHIDCSNSFPEKREFIHALYNPNVKTSSSHVILRIMDDIYFDSNGWHISLDYYTDNWGKYWLSFDIAATHYILFALNNKPQQWSMCYDKKKCNPTLKRQIKSAVSTVLRREYGYTKTKEFMLVAGELELF